MAYSVNVLAAKARVPSLRFKWWKERTDSLKLFPNLRMCLPTNNTYV